MKLALAAFSALVLLSAFAIQPAAAAAQPGRSLVIIMNPDCDGEFGKNLIHDLKISISFKEYVSPFEVACGPALSFLGFDGIRNFFMPILRVFYPADVFVFAYPESMTSAFQQYIVKYHRDEITSWDADVIERGAIRYRGHSNIEQGFAFASDNHDTILHEAAHLSVVVLGTIIQRLNSRILAISFG